MAHRRRLWAVLLVTGFALRAPAQSRPCVNRSITAQIYSKKGNPVTTLRAANFKLRIGPREVPVKRAAYVSAPRRIVLLVDVSGSMMGGKRAHALAFARNMITLAPPGDSLALLAFSEKTDAVVDFGRSRAALTSETYTLQQTRWPPGKGRTTAIRNALVNTLTLMRKAQPGDAICLITDGNDNASDISRASVRKLLESDGVRVYAFVLPGLFRGRGTGRQSVMSPRTIRSSGSARTNASLPLSVVAPRAGFGLPFPPAGVTRMQHLATDTGGGIASFVPETVVLDSGRVEPISSGAPDDLARTARAFLGEIASFENLEFTLPAPLAKTRSVRLEVMAPSGRREKNLRVVYPHQLAPCN